MLNQQQSSKIYLRNLDIQELSDCKMHNIYGGVQKQQTSSGKTLYERIAWYHESKKPENQLLPLE